MSVGDDDPFDFELMAIEDVLDLFELIAGVDDERRPRFFVAEDGAVALQRADRKDFVDHCRYNNNSLPADLPVGFPRLRGRVKVSR